MNIGLIGYGVAGAAFHAPLIAAVPRLRLAAIVTGNPDRQEAAGLAYPDAAILTTTAQLWERAADLNVVVIASPNRYHVPLARQALALGLHVVVDKPLATTAADGRMLIDEARRRSRMLTVFHNRRWDGDFLTVRQLLASGALGAPMRFESRFERWRPEPKPGWRELAAAEEAGGILYDLGSHLIDQALVLFGRVSHVYAEVDSRRAGVEVDDDSFVALTHVSGVRSHLLMTAVAAQFQARMRVLGSTAAYVKYGLDVQEEALRRDRRVTLQGWGEEPPESWGEFGAGEERKTIRTVPGNYVRFYEGVADALEGAAPPVDPLDAVAGLEIIEAARESSASRRVIELVLSQDDKVTQRM